MSTSQEEPAARKRKIDHLSSDVPGNNNFHPTAQAIKSEPKSDSPMEIAYNGPSIIHVVVLRITNESSARPMPQAAFFNHDKALTFALKVLLQFSEAHYDDYVWNGPEKLNRHHVSRYVVHHSQTGERLVFADVIKVCIFDTKDTKVACSVDGVDKEDVDMTDTAQDKAWQAEESVLQQLPAAIADKIAAEVMRTASDMRNGHGAWREEEDMKILGGSSE